MFRRARGDGAAALTTKKHLAKSDNASAEEQLNKRLESEIEQLLNSFGEIIQSSRVHNRDIGDILAGMRPSRRRPKEQVIRNTGDAAGSQEDEGDAYDSQGDESANEAANDAAAAAVSSGARSEPTKDKYVVAQEAYSAQTRAATMVRSVENLLAMVSDIKRAYLVNDTITMTAMADKRRKLLESRTQITRSEIEELGAALDTAVRELETVYYNSKYVK
ncbi:hypothetical protein GGI25_002461 [Coemansia spiralis]|uniref:Uncharacterized protein n=2 Tax=Coemansia TaxID=4863 RepID=A0A9W8G8T0_9FUNG|nr:hypothetical protein BX070DRAFT_132664 [Coemansia spiralis]KAJ1995425.1 hypothetical protein EDC05_000977 [Coemansia umbellata]KAJ2624746.1 hypothetical protein GGI26_001162 [Coemansia sp. RSA 1358]KAJ2678289.1 hypothetical protein GGI25_002461 [Coemansia spiralis]